MDSAQKQILMEIATSSGAYETEYDGRTYVFCTYCEANVGELGEDAHDEDCTILRAREALGTVWQDHIKAIEEEQRKEREKQEAIEEKKRKADLQREYERKKIACPLCESLVTRIGMVDHQKSQRCQRKAGEARTGIKCISNTDSYDGKRCLCCKKPMPSAHPNKKFCSNRGQGNCKDRYHNAIDSSRMMRNPHRQRHVVGDSYEWEDQSWDAHKDQF